MGGGRWDSATWSSYSTGTYGTSDRAKLRGMNNASMFKSRSMDPGLDPAKVKDTVTGTRESRDSADNPLATPILLGTDVTGSMGHLAQEVLSAMDVVCTELYDRRPVTDPHILTAAIGDLFCDSAPLQVTQFEADIRIAEQTQKLWIEHGGGGNYGESYAGFWFFAGMLTSSDAWDKRKEKGWLFTVGDEPCLGSKGLIGAGLGRGHPDGVAITRAQAKRFFGLDIEADLSAEDCYDLAAQRYEIFHICVNRNYEPGVKASFGSILGDRLIWMQDTAHLPELIVSAIQVAKGADAATVAGSWSGDTSVAIKEALGGLAVAGAGGPGGGGVAAL